MRNLKLPVPESGRELAAMIETLQTAYRNRCASQASREKRITTKTIEDIFRYIESVGITFEEFYAEYGTLDPAVATERQIVEVLDWASALDTERHEQEAQFTS